MVLTEAFGAACSGLGCGERDWYVLALPPTYRKLIYLLTAPKTTILTEGAMHTHSAMPQNHVSAPLAKVLT